MNPRQTFWFVCVLIALTATVTLAVMRHNAFVTVALVGFAPALGGYLASRTSQRSTIFGAIRWTLIAAFVAATVGELSANLADTPQKWGSGWLESVARILFIVLFVGLYGCFSAIIMELLSRAFAWFMARHHPVDRKGQPQ